MRARSVIALLFTALFAFSALTAPAASSPPGEDGCREFIMVEYQGPSCRFENGWLVLLADGTTTFTHGPDLIPPASLPASPPGTGGNPTSIMPACVSNTDTQYHHHFIYAHSASKASRHASLSSTLRTLVNQSEALIRSEARAFDADIGYKFSCDAVDKITISDVEVPASSSGDFSGIVSSLRSQGFTNSRAKYWVWWDGSMGAIGGQGTIWNDDRGTASNANNNGNIFALTYGILGSGGVRVLMHENGHNMGAVQNSAPQSSGGFHCNDGLDIMCYSDGGSKSAYTSGVCNYQRYDCNNDDYFHPSPPAGSYLATRWNIAATYNRFLDFNPPGPIAPIFRYQYCQPNVINVGEPATCNFSTSDYENVSYVVDFGDGSPTVRVPETGSIWPEEMATTTHAWAAKGNYTVTVTATDTSPQQLSRVNTFDVRVGCTLVHTGRLLLGLRGHEVSPYSYVDKPVTTGCHGEAFRLKGPSSLSDFNLCWLDANGVRIQCHDNVGDETGIIPQDAVTARIVLYEGFDANYRLEGI